MNKSKIKLVQKWLGLHDINISKPNNGTEDREGKDFLDSILLTGIGIGLCLGGALSIALLLVTKYLW